MTWDEVDLDHRVWTLPATCTKNDKHHIVQLSDPVVVVIGGQPRSGRFVFSRNGVAANWRFLKREKRRLDDLCCISQWRLHDLRRTMVSGMARHGVAPHVADKILNHVGGTISGVAAVYQRHEFLKERRDALGELGRTCGWPASRERSARTEGRLVSHKQLADGRTAAPATEAAMT